MMHTNPHLKTETIMSGQEKNKSLIGATSQCVRTFSVSTFFFVEFLLTIWFALPGVGPGCTDKTLLSAIASALHTSAAPITGQLSAAVEKNPGVWLNTAQPLCKAFIVTDEDIRSAPSRSFTFVCLSLIFSLLNCLIRHRCDILTFPDWKHVH